MSFYIFTLFVGKKIFHLVILIIFYQLDATRLREMLNVCVILDGLKSRVPSVENDSRVFFYLPLCVREKKLFGNVKKNFVDIFK